MTPRLLNIVYVIPSAEISGGTYVACEHAMRLKRRGHNVQFAVPRGSNSKLSWFPDCDIPIIPLEDLPPDSDALIATWWETAYLIAKIPARAKFYLIQSIESRFYDSGQKAETLFSSMSYRFDYRFITVAKWLAGWLDKNFHREACLVKNQINTDLFHPVSPNSPELDSLSPCDAFLDIVLRSRHPTEAQVFWDTGSGFSEKNSVMFEVPAGWVERVVPLRDISRMKRLRIDAGSTARNTVEFSRIRLIATGGLDIDLLDTKRWHANPDVAEFCGGGGVVRVVSSGRDPFIICPIHQFMAPPQSSGESGKNSQRGRILVEGPLGIEFKGVRKALRIAMETGCEVWFVEGKAESGVLDGILAHRVFYRVPLDKMKYIYSSCDILLKLSRVESFAYPPLEMMACGGTPVVGDVEGIREYMVDGYNGFIVDPDNEEEIKTVLSRLINDSVLRNSIKTGCRETVERLSDWEAQIDVLEKCLVDTVNVPPPGKAVDSKITLGGEDLVNFYIDIIRCRDGRSRDVSVLGEPVHAAKPRRRKIPLFLSKVRSRMPGLIRRW
jgi:glycosyltransferase involved in cell wall biosynthesis